jgi:hypothetical protein
MCQCPPVPLHFGHLISSKLKVIALSNPDSGSAKAREGRDTEEAEADESVCAHQPTPPPEKQVLELTKTMTRHRPPVSLRP